VTLTANTRIDERVARLPGSLQSGIVTRLARTHPQRAARRETGA
jgi:hypothetical protein